MREDAKAKTPGQPALPLSLRCLNHISRVCRDVSASAAFYRDILGFSEVKRPSSFEFEGAWLFNYGVGVHLIAGQPVARSRKIEPKSDHLSFQVECLDTVEKQLKELNLPYVRQQIEEGGVLVTQLFFHDPDDNMIEICNCDLIPVILLDSEPLCSACMNSSYTLRTASMSPGPCSDSDTTIMNHLELPLSLSHSNSSLVSESDTFSSGPSATRGVDCTLPAMLMAGTTPHTGARMGGGGLRRACSMSMLTSHATQFPAVTVKEAMARVTPQRL